VLAYEVRLRDKTALFALSASVLWLLVAQLLLRRIWITHALMFPLYVVVVADLYVISNYQTRLASNMILTIVENIGDARDFIESDFTRTVGSLVLMMAAYGYCLPKIRDLRVTLPRWVVFVPLGAVALVYLGVHHYVGEWSTVILNDRNSPFGIVSQSFLTVSLHRQEVRERERARFFHFGAKRAQEPDEPELYVLVIGESARRHNWSLYGYQRETNPRLSKIDNLIVFRDVVTQVAQTQVSVPLILTRGTIEDPLRTAGETSIVSVFHELGFRTYWLSTQQREMAMSAISRHTNEADIVRFFERRHDGVIVDTMREILAKPSGHEKKMFFMLHTLGSHFNLSSRYPREFAAFPDGERSLLSGTSATLTHAELIGAYDNTILYTDYVLSELIELLRQHPGIKALLYVPDHGDNLRDDARNLFGHAHSNEYDVPIPMLFWYSKEYDARFPDKVKTAIRNAGRPLNTRTVFYSLTDMADITLDDKELPQRSVFSADLVNTRRFVYGDPRPFDFDEWIVRTGTKIPTVVPPE
jgi:glucan phosphoethanolaminetransferase (alkaline phosphatase superfamily)